MNMIDQRIELLSIIHMFSKYGAESGTITSLSNPYISHINKWIDKYRNHTVFELTDTLSDYGFTFDAPIQFILSFPGVPLYEENVEIDKYVLSRAKGELNLSRYQAELNDFIRVSNYEDFFHSNKNYYENIVATFKELIPPSAYKEELQDYYGISIPEPRVILSPLMKGNYGVKTGINQYCIQGLDAQVDFSGLKTGSLKHLLWHELSHPVINPLTEKYQDELERVRNLYDLIADEMTKQAYGDWESCAIEHIIRAITARIVLKEMGRENYEYALKHEKGRCFVYLEFILGRLEFYEDNRDKYGSIKDFFSEIIKGITDIRM